MGAAPTADLEDGAAPVCGMAARGLNDLSCKSCSLRGRRDDEATDVSSMSAHTVLQAGHSARAHDLPVIADGNEGYGTSALLLSHSILDHRGRLLEGGPAEAVPLKVASIPFAYGPNEHVVTVVREVSRVQLVASLRRPRTGGAVSRPGTRQRTRGVSDQPCACLVPLCHDAPVILYSTDSSDITEQDLCGFFVGWPSPPTPEQHLAVLRGSYRVVIAHDAASHRVVGFVNMISDGVLTAFIPWLEVVPEYQGKGIGSELMRRVLAAAEHVYSVDLTCDEQLRPYYERLGMQAITGMAIRRWHVLNREGEAG